MTVSYTITITDEEDLALKAQLEDVQKWIQDAVVGKADKCVERVIEAITNTNPKKLTNQQKLDLISQNSDLIEPKMLRTIEVVSP